MAKDYFKYIDSPRVYNSKVTIKETKGYSPVILKTIKRIRIKQLVYYLAVLGILAGAFLFVQKVVKANNTFKLNAIQLKSTEFKLNELNRLYDQVIEEKTTTEAEKKSQDKKIQDLEIKKQELEKQLQSKLAEKAKVASIQIAQTAVASGNPKMLIYMHESGNNPSAINQSSGACGLGQALPCSKMPCSLSDYTCQDNFFTTYMVSRYGTWDNAWVFWQNHLWW